MDEILGKYFGEKSVVYFNPADIIENSQYLAYRRHRKSVILTVGSDGGEVDIGVLRAPEELEHCIKHIIYGTWGT